MEQQQGTAYQLDLFGRTIQDTLRPSQDREAVSGAEDRKELQVKGAGEQKRALTEHLMQVVCSHAITSNERTSR